MAKCTRYRDTKTGKFVSKGTWRRSRSQDGTRYRRTSFVVRTGPRTTTGGRPPGAVPIPHDQPIPGAAFIPREFLDTEDMFFGGEEYDEEAEY